MTSIPAPICFSCSHIYLETDAPACDAFPNGIPMSILLSEADHRLPYPGDNGILFEQDLTLPLVDAVPG